MLLLDQKMLAGPLFKENFDELNVVSVKNASERWVRPCIFKKLYKPDHPNLKSPIPANVNVWTKRRNFKADAVDLDIDRFC